MKGGGGEGPGKMGDIAEGDGDHIRERELGRYMVKFYLRDPHFTSLRLWHHVLEFCEKSLEAPELF